MDLSESTLAMGKLALIFVAILVLLRFKIKLWLCILGGSLVAALLTGVSPAGWPGIFFGALTDTNFIILVVMIFLILMLSGVQEATGQSRRMVRGLEHYLHSPRLRLVIFPALVGLLPMPGGALFSCPMIKAAAEGMGVTDRQKSLINYWFRHIWELAWPLYPGYVLICSLLGLQLTDLWLYTFPLVFSAFGVGWFFYMRELARSEVMREHESILAAEKPEENSLGEVLLHGLPIALVLVGALVFGFLFSRLLPQLPGQLAFCAALVVSIAVALYQGRGRREKPLHKIAFTPNVGRIFLLLAAIYVFKDTVAASGLVQSMSRLGSSDVMLVITFMLVPFCAGLLTGLMLGFVGLCFPILIGIVQQSPMQEYTLPLVVLAMVAGNCGQLLSPVHVCLVVTGEFFTTTLPRLLRSLALPTLALGIVGSLWALILALAGVHL